MFKEPALNGFRKIKVTHDFLVDHHFAVDPKVKINGFPLQYYWFAKIITNKLLSKGYDFTAPYIPEQGFNVASVPDRYIGGVIYKQSQHLKSWVTRFIVIGPDGMFSFKS